MEKCIHRTENVPVGRAFRKHYGDFAWARVYQEGRRRYRIETETAVDTDRYPDDWMERNEALRKIPALSAPETDSTDAIRIAESFIRSPSKWKNRWRGPP